MILNDRKKKNFIHFAFSAINFERILDVTKRNNRISTAKICARNVGTDDLNFDKCYKLFLTVVLDGNFADVSVQKQISDNTLLMTLAVLQEMEPEELSIALYDDPETTECDMEIMILYDENVATVFYDSSIRKREIIHTFANCFN